MVALVRQTAWRGVRGGGHSFVGVENEVEHDIAHDIVGEHREQRVWVARSEREPGYCCEAVDNWVSGSFPGEKAPFLQRLVGDQ